MKGIILSVYRLESKNIGIEIQNKETGCWTRPRLRCCVIIIIHFIIEINDRTRKNDFELGLCAVIYGVCRTFLDFNYNL